MLCVGFPANNSGRSVKETPPGQGERKGFWSFLQYKSYHRDLTSSKYPKPLNLQGSN